MNNFTFAAQQDISPGLKRFSKILFYYMAFLAILPLIPAIGSKGLTPEIIIVAPLVIFIVEAVFAGFLYVPFRLWCRKVKKLQKEKEAVQRDIEAKKAAYQKEHATEIEQHKQLIEQKRELEQQLFGIHNIVGHSGGGKQARTGESQAQLAARSPAGPAQQVSPDAIGPIVGHSTSGKMATAAQQPPPPPSKEEHVPSAEEEEIKRKLDLLEAQLKLEEEKQQLELASKQDQIVQAQNLERAARYQEAASLYEELDMWDQAGACRIKDIELRAPKSITQVKQTVYNTTVQDSVVTGSSIGGGPSAEEEPAPQPAASPAPETQVIAPSISEPIHVEVPVIDQPQVSFDTDQPIDQPVVEAPPQEVPAPVQETSDEPPPPSDLVCDQCGKPCDFIEKYKRYYCRECQRYN